MNTDTMTGHAAEQLLNLHSESKQLRRKTLV